MADKEAAVFIVDLGRTMAETHNGREETNLDWAMRFVWSKLGDIAATGRKTLCAAVVGLRTEGTENSLGVDEGYAHISVLKDLGPVSLDTLRNLQDLVQPQPTSAGDAISSIVVAVDMIETFTKKQKWARKIFLVTDGEASMDADDMKEIARKMDECNIQLNVLGVDFDDADYGFKEENKSKTKAANEKHLRDLADMTKDGQFATIAEAIDALDIPRVKQTRPYKSYDGTLTLGNPEEFPSSISINVERYFKTHRAAAVSASTVTIKTGAEGVEEVSEVEAGGEQMEGLEFSAVRNARTYKVNDPDAPGGKRDVEFESLAKGYEYGRTAVHISESEYNITRLESVKSFTIMGFVQKTKYEPFLTMGEAGIIVPRKGDVHSQLALSSLVWALEELDSYAVGRIVTKDAKDPLVVLLAPCIEPNLEALYDIPLPFAEDVRTYQFPPLDRVITVSGTTVTKHRLLPSDDLTEAMSDYVDTMDLSVAARDEEGEPAEYAQPDDVYSPIIHRLNHAIRDRALYPNKPIPKIPQTLLQFTAPPSTLAEQASSEINALIDAAEVKKVPPKAKGKRYREVAKPISGLDVDALLGQPKKTPISKDNSVPEFKRAMATSNEISEIEDASRQMGDIIRGLVTDSFSDRLYSRAVENMGVMRLELINMEEPGLYNRFVRDFKKRILSGELGGDRRDFWLVVKRSRLGLIDKSQSEVSDVTDEEVEEFYKSR